MFEILPSSHLNWRHFEESGEAPHADLAPLELRGGELPVDHAARREAVAPRFDPALVEGQPRYEPEGV